MGEMTSRERVIKTLGHQQPDRIPFDLGSTLVTGITKNAYINLATTLGKEPAHVKLYDTIQQLPDVSEEILRELEVDIRGLIPNFARKNPRLQDDGHCYWFVDEWGVKWKMPKGALYFSVDESPFSGNVSKKDIDNFPWPDAGEPGLFEGLQDKASKYYQQGYAVILENLCAGIFEMCCRVRGTEQFCMDLAMNPDMASKLLDKFVELKIRFYEAASERLADYVQFIREGDDVAGQESMLISPQMYREFLKPRHRQLFEAQRRFFGSDFYIFFHSDGAIYGIIKDFIEIGLDVLNPVQLTAKGMDAKELKSEYGKDISLWGGGVNTQHVLPTAGADEVRRNVEERIKKLSVEGGFIFGTVHNIQDDVPVENITAMVETFKRLRNY